MFQINYPKISSKILKLLPQKQKEVILRRFGLESGKKETLERIGCDFGVTRERIRQIEADAFGKLEKRKEEIDLKKAFFQFNQYLRDQGGLKREDILLSQLGRNRFQNQVYFLLCLGDSFYRFPEKEEFYSFWTIEKNLEQKAGDILKNLVKDFEKEKKPLSEDKFFNLSKNEPSGVFPSVVEISKKIERGPLNQFGLISWPEIKPKGVRDKAYLALRKTTKPLHFREIAVLAGQIKGEWCKQKEVFPQTVHNELIRDKRFVLVGRGIYGLREWGYSPGTVKDVVREILEKAKKPLTREEITEEALSQRLVKKNTILLNLQNKKLFAKDNQGRYNLKKK